MTSSRRSILPWAGAALIALAINHQPRDHQQAPRCPVARHRAGPPERVQVAQHRPQPRRPIDRRRGRQGPAARRLLRRHGRRPVEDDRRRQRPGRRSPTGRSTARRSARSPSPSPTPTSLYIGMGESCIRGNIMPGDGVYKSTDAGKTWTHVGFRESDAIARSASTPPTTTSSSSPASGSYGGPSDERGVFKSVDGGKTWKKVLFRDDKTGAVDIVDRSAQPERDVRGAVGGVPHRVPDVERRPGQRPVQVHRRRRDLDGDHAQPRACRRAWSAGSASPCRAPIRTASTRWSRTRTAASSCPTTPARRWKLMNAARSVRQRAFYYTHVSADPNNKDTVYMLNTSAFRSTDGGKTLTQHRPGHARRPPRPLDRSRRLGARRRSATTAAARSPTTCRRGGRRGAIRTSRPRSSTT